MVNIYGLDAEGTRWAEAAGRLAGQIALPAAVEVDQQGRYPQEAMRELAEQGFWGLCLPAELGGRGQPPRVFAAVVEQLARACPSTAMIYVMHVVAGQTLVASSCVGERSQLVAAMAEGRHLTTLAFSERGSRSQFWAPVSRLEPAGTQGGYVTSAMKSWVTAANHADSYVCSAQMPAAQSPLQSTLYLARRQAPGVRVTGRFDGLGLRGNDSAPVELEAVAVALSDLITAPGEGAPMMLEVALPWFCVGTTAMAHGLCLAAVGATAEHLAQTRFEHDGQRLRDLPNLRARLAAMSVQTEQSRALLGLAAALMEAPDEQTPLYVLRSRLAGLEAALAVTDMAMKSCGGAAFSRHLGVERWFRDARAGWVMAPTADHLNDFIGRALTGMPLF